MDDEVQKVVTLPLSVDRWVRFTGPFPMTNREWDLMVKVLFACKPALIARSPKDAFEQAEKEAAGE